MTRGFTLVETLITLVLLAALGSMAVHLVATSYRETALSVQRTADQCRLVFVMEQLVADARAFQAREQDHGTLSAHIATQPYGTDVRVVTAPLAFSTETGRALSDLLLITVEKNSMRLSRVFSP